MKDFELNIKKNQKFQIDHINKKSHIIYSNEKLDEIYNLIEESGEGGISFESLKSLTTLLKTDLMNILYKLNNEPSPDGYCNYIEVVGFNNLLYVSYKHFEPHSIIMITNVDESITFHSEASSIHLEYLTKKLIKPRIWVDINGNILESLFNSLLCCILINVVDKPGIDKNVLYKQMSHLLNHVEFKILLEHLTQNCYIHIKDVVRSGDENCSGWKKIMNTSYTQNYNQEEMNSNHFECIFPSVNWFKC